MNAFTVLQSLSDIDPAYIADAEQIPARRFRPRALIAACLALLCLVAAVVSVFTHPAGEPPLITSSALQKDADTDLITVYDGPQYLEACYAAPRDGDVLLEIELTLALQQYEQEDVRYWVRLAIFPKDGCLNFDEAATDAECARLASLGYAVYTHKKNWIGYWGEDKHYTTVCLKMSADELRAFEAVAADRRFGYAFELVHTPTVSDCTRYEIP